ncbi:hypothetical protein [Lewinella sp. 4G2]|uniref:hypothetical protein n=1 Tax=Lewinella sp. 4G2 TaxID=1803372 RepID=UPI0007B483BC|nr:hypothetical protein [Lewinella sp. 4G2]OAV42682.1 hypothetical protein A3850_015685 [Lewinella sp. 4G2]
MLLKRYLLLVLFGVLSCAGRLPGQSDAPVPRIHRFTAEDHGGGVQNWAVTQDAAGRIYVANPAGVLRYDGVKWLTLPLPGSPTVRAVLADGNRVYAGGYGEFGYFQLSDHGGAEWHSLAAQLSVADRNEEIWHIERLADGRVMFQSFGKFFMLEGETITKVSPPGVMMFARADGNELIVPVTGAGLYRWTAESGFRFLPGSEELGEREVVGMVKRPDGLLVATGDGIYVLRQDKLDSWSAELNELLGGSEINRLLQLRDGTLAIGTITSGVFFYQQTAGTFSQLNETTGLSNNTVLALSESQWGNVWLGLDRGLDMIDRSKLIRYHVGNDRPPGAVYAAIKHGGQAYVGTNQGLYRWDNARERYELVRGTSGQVWELRVLDGELLCGHNNGTYAVQGDVAKIVSDRSGGWASLPLPDQPRTLIQATYTGLQLLQKEDGVYVTHGIAGLDAPIRYLTRTGDREFLALHGSRGGYRVKLSDDYRSIVQLDTINAPGLIKASPADFGETLLVQTQDSLYEYADGVLRSITEFRGVPLQSGNQCLVGRDSSEWFLYAADRIGVYRGRDFVTNLPLRLRFPFPIIIPWADDDYLFLLDQGYARVSVQAERRPVANMLLNAETANQRGWQQLAAGSHSINQQSDQPIELSYGENDVRFSFALPVYDRPVSYRSRLVGYAGGQWSDWSPTGTRSFTSLPAGDYRFEVEANWFDAGNALHFSIAPPWYRSKLAYLLYGVLLVALLYLLYLLHLQRLRAQARRLEIVRQRELQQQRVLARNQELNANVRRKTEELANTTLTLAKKNEMLLVLKEEIERSRRTPEKRLDHRKMQHLIDRNLNNEEDWAIFESHFNEVHEAFLKRLRKTYPNLTTGDLRLSAYLRMGLSSKEIAPLLHISVRGVENKRYRLRKKLGLESGGDLNTYLLDF